MERMRLAAAIGFLCEKAVESTLNGARFQLADGSGLHDDY